ncbi:indolepyruvate ferredoxin oxidoreductase family protein (plasmid) [Pseudorhodobacter turbinis]|uniref:Indolepyruvate ferredoxin oxidoreductase family protein n=1 Tax=Pseudorhodobacter turbinis TaxID=2500533 RepID=A0A4P8EI40_9RHOB|nr:indolepyruvate ferredoxin oxidoreductase family protein [Pseudorhodobacter turbinis]QCO56820.1 indolepyruvate ferredoxin oxidoreductase family protein [Pseudorhodobacter turbinis]
MTKHEVSLNDRLDLTKSPVLMNGTQALVRLMLMQKARDTAAGLNTAGLVTGYRGSPLGAVDQQMMRAEKTLQAADITFQPGLNEDLAATAIWGSQQAELRGQGRFDGVFGLWYGKGPGVDRSGDVMRHANLAGTSRHGGVIMALGDDHTGESSTTCHQSEWAAVDASIPVISPAGVQEILDYGLYAYALSRFSGLWTGLKLMKDTVEATSVVDARLDRMQFVVPDFAMPPGGLNIRLADHWVPQEERLVNHKRFAAEAFSRANGMDRRVWGKPGAKIGLVAAGKNWLDLVHALSLLGIDEAEAERLGITTYKVGQPWPLDMHSFHDWADGLDLIIVVEEKRKLIEVQIKESIFDDRRGRRVWGGRKGSPEAEVLFPVPMSLDPVMIARKLGGIFVDEGRGTDRLKDALQRLDQVTKSDNAEDIAARLPYFCSGCPHNTSTLLPEGARAGGGIGCHTMALWMDRGTSGLTQMGGEGMSWVGEAPFSKTEHVFQNLGDGTYNHSGILAIRGALAAGTNITYKILYNDAVAMTGGQDNEGDLDAYRIVAEVQAMGVQNIAVVYDPKQAVNLSLFPSSVQKYTRDAIIEVQEKFSKIKGVSVIVYIQTCAAEKRRRRKRGLFPDPDKRVFINTDICEGCGDCGVQSNCVSIVPVETELGRKRAIDQSSCNKDYSCVSGFCPSFLTLEGARIKRAATAQIDLPDLPDPVLPLINGTYNVVITGVGGTGVVTVGAILAMAAHVDGKGAGMMEMAGLAQKGGAVHIHCRLAESPADISAIRVAVGEADAVIGGDLVVSAGAKTLGLMTTGRTGAVVNSHEIITGEFTQNTEFRIPSDRLQLSLEARLNSRVAFFDATELARATLGDSIYSNMLVFGAAWQQGLIPLSLEAISAAITLNGAGPERNLRAFSLGRWAVSYPDAVAKILAPEVADAADPIAFRLAHLRDYGDAERVAKFEKLVEEAPETLKLSVAKGYHKLLAIKDEYEVARLHLDSVEKARNEFDGELKPTFHLAPPFLPGRDALGRPKKRAFGPWIVPLFRMLVRMRALRGKWYDPFGQSVERRMEHALIAEYEADMHEVFNSFNPEKSHIAKALAELPLTIRGFGPVKHANALKAAETRAQLLADWRKGLDGPLQAAE